MARVRLGRYEAEEGQLPFLCLRCGAPASLTRYKTFSWHPSWINWLILLGLCFNPLLIAGLVVAFAMSKRMRVRVPLCQAHRNHWRWRSWFIYGGTALFVVLGLGSLCLWTFLGGDPRRDQRLSEAAGWFCAGSGLTALVWLIAAAIVQMKAIHADEITERSMTLVKVAPEFAQAVAENRETRREEDADDYSESPRLHARDTVEYYDPEVRPRRPPPEVPREDD